MSQHLPTKEAIGNLKKLRQDGDLEAGHKFVMAVKKGVTSLD